MGWEGGAVAGRHMSPHRPLCHPSTSNLQPQAGSVGLTMQESELRQVRVEGEPWGQIPRSALPL